MKGRSCHYHNRILHFITKAAAFVTAIVVIASDEHPPTAKSVDSEPTTNYWAFKPLVRPPVPVITSQTARIISPIDPFIIEKLSENGLLLAPPADKAVLLR